MLCSVIIIHYSLRSVNMFLGVLFMKFLGKIPERIKELRVQNNVTQKQLAAILSVSEVSVQRFEYGTARPSLDTLIIISDYFNVSLDYLVGRSDNPIKEVLYMAIQSNPYPLRVDKSLMDKFKIIAAENGRSVNKEIEMLMKNAVSLYEQKHGIIENKNLSE